MEGLKLDEHADKSTVPPETTKQPADKAALFGQVLLVLHVCLANERNRIHFDVSVIAFTKGFGTDVFGSVFQSLGGWSAYEPALRLLCYPTQPTEPSQDLGPDHTSLREDNRIHNRIPDLRFIGSLWSVACNSESTLVDLFGRFDKTLKDPSDAESRIPDFPEVLPISANLVLTHSSLLPIILDLTPLPYTLTAKTTYPAPSRRPSHPQPLTTEQRELESLTYRILIVILQSSWSNLFKSQKVLPSIYEAILKRIYGAAVGKREPSEMARSLELEPARRKGKDQHDSLPRFMVSGSPMASPGGTLYGGAGGNAEPPLLSKPTTRKENHVHEIADTALRPILLKLLRRLVEAGVPTEYAHMLFRLAKKSDAPTALAIIKNAQAAEGDATPTAGGPRSNESSPSKSPAGKRTRPAKPMSLKLALNVLAGSAKNGPAVLDQDILEILRHGMSKRWPNVFMFSPELGGSEGGLVCNNLGKVWPTSAKGYYFMAWVYVEHMCGPITLLHVYESKRTLLRIRILPNSQVGVTASRPEDDHEALEEVIFSSSDSLVPHQKWIHIAVAGRRPRNPASSPTEVKLLINGRRTQAMKCQYPKPTTMGHLPGAEVVMAAVGKEGQRVPVGEEGIDFDSMGLERSTWFLGHSMLLGEYVGDDLALLLYYLVSRLDLFTSMKCILKETMIVVGTAISEQYERSFGKILNV
jgi:hypothetical protein